MSLKSSEVRKKLINKMRHYRQEAVKMQTAPEERNKDLF